MEKPTTLFLSKIQVDPSIQPRTGGIDADHVRALEESPESWGPLAVVLKGKQHVLVDGFHRLAAAQHLGLDSVAVRVLDSPEDGDLRALAFELNARHGRPLSLTDRRAEAARVLLLHPEQSDREIGRRCGLAQPTVAKIRTELEAAASIEHVARRVGADAKSYPAPPHRPGELPPPSFGDMAGNIGARLFSKPERIRQRKIAAYLRRLAVALEGQADLLSDPEAAAEAIQLVLGAEQADALAARLAQAVEPVVKVVTILGWMIRAK